MKGVEYRKISPRSWSGQAKMPRARAGAGAVAAAALRLRKKNDDAPIHRAQQTGSRLKSQSGSDAFQRAESGESPTSGRVALDKRVREEEEKRKKSFSRASSQRKRREVCSTGRMTRDALRTGT